MAILALDTSTQVCGVALGSFGAEGYDVLYERNESLQRTHSRLLLPMVRAALLETGLRPDQIEAIAVTEGPGSFTGIRIAMSTAKGLACAWHVPVIPVGTLDAIALGVEMEGLVCPVLDARRGAVYAGLFRCGSPAEMESVTPVDAYGPSALVSLLMDRSAGAEVLLLGDATEIVTEAAKGLPLESRLKVYNGDWHPRSGNVARLAAFAYRRGQMVRAEDVVPAYFRRSEAEEKWDAR